jgi:hypothetical protein
MWPGAQAVAGRLGVIVKDYREHGRNAEADVLAQHMRGIDEKRLSPYRL